jgi:cell division protein FtsB
MPSTAASSDEIPPDTMGREPTREIGAVPLRMNYWATIYRCLWGLAVILVVVVMISFFIPKYRTLRDYQKKRQELQQENSQKEAMIRDLKHKQERIVSDPAFVKRVAREAGMAEENELVIKFTNGVSRVTPSPNHTN